MTSHHDVAGLLLRLRSRVHDAPMDHEHMMDEAIKVLESQAKALSEAEASNTILWQINGQSSAQIKTLVGQKTEWMGRALAAEARLADKEAELSIARQINHDLTDGITGTLQKDKIENLETFRAEAMKVIEPLLNAKALAGVRALVAGWNGEGRDEPYKERHPYRLGATLPTCCGAVYELDEAMEAARAFTNAANSKQEKNNAK